MSFLNNDDNFHDLRRQEEYERQKNEQLTRGVGNFLYLYIAYGFVWLCSSAFTAVVLENMFGVGAGLSFLIGIVSGIVIFKVPYVKANPFKSLIMICFIFGLFIVAFPESS